MLIETAVVFLLAAALCGVIIQMFGTCVLWMQKNKMLDECWTYLQERQCAMEAIEVPEGLSCTETVRENDGLMIKELQVKKNDEVIMNLIWAEDE